MKEIKEAKTGRGETGRNGAVDLALKMEEVASEAAARLPGYRNCGLIAAKH